MVYGVCKENFIFNFMVKIRLQRCGRKNHPFYRVVATDARRKRDGSVLKNLGYYDPLTFYYLLNIEQIELLQKKGARVTDRVIKLAIFVLKETDWKTTSKKQDPRTRSRKRRKRKLATEGKETKKRDEPAPPLRSRSRYSIYFEGLLPGLQRSSW